MIMPAFRFGPLVLLMWCCAAGAAPPQYLRAAVGYSALIHADGAIEHYWTTGEPGAQSVVRIRSADSGKTWSEPETIFSLPAEQKWAGRSPQPMIDRDGALHLFLLDVKEPGMATWHIKQPRGQTQFTPIKRICSNGLQNPPIQLASGRIVVPIGYFLTERVAWDAPTGRSEVACWLSDDGGDSWKRSTSTLTVHSSTDYPGRHGGGFEPVIAQLRDGRVWMLIRTQNGWLYESFSDDGDAWSTARPSEFRSSDAPASLVRLKSGDLMIAWNNCDMPKPVEGKFIYTGRDALHAAISSDDGKTWRGFREVMLDPKRDESPPPTGDRGTAYPSLAADDDGAALLIAGQGPGRTRLIRIDPAWLTERSAASDFSNGLDDWSVFKSHGPVVGYKRQRVAGAQLIPNPQSPGNNVLHLKTDDKGGDGATWNFPAAREGKVSLRVMLRKGFAGGAINLTDRFLYPDETDEDKVAFSLRIPADGVVGAVSLEPDRWHDLELSWKTEHQPPRGGWPGVCTVLIDGKPAVELPQLNRAKAGLSYLRLHSTAPRADEAGFLIDRVAAKAGGGS